VTEQSATKRSDQFAGLSKSGRTERERCWAKAYSAVGHLLIYMSPNDQAGKDALYEVQRLLREIET